MFCGPTLQNSKPVKFIVNLNYEMLEPMIDLKPFALATYLIFEY